MFKNSIRNKLIVLLLLITIIPFGSSVLVTYLYTKETLTEETTKESVNLLYQGKINIENYLNELNNLSLSIYNNPDLMNHLKSSNYQTNYLMQDIVSNVMLTLLYANDSIKRVTISNTEKNYRISVSARSNVVFTSLGMNVNKEIFHKAKNSPNHLFIESIYQNDQLNSIAFHRAIVNVPANNIVGYITLEIDPDKLSELSQRLYHNETEELDIVSPEGDFIFRSDNNEVEHHKQPWVKELLESEDDSGVREQRDEHFDGIIVYQRISEKLGDWLLIKRLPYTSLYQSANEVGLINIGFGLIGLALVIMATFFVSFKITSPIRVLVQSIQQIDKDNMQVPFKSLGNDEIGMLGDRFKQMIERINRLINRELKLEIENKANQLKVLQSQINPHFLYNALQSIGTLALKSNAPKVYALITQLSKIMRYGMDMKEDMVLLEKEVEYIKAYLLLNKERFDDQFQYNLEFDPDTLDCKVPKMIIQPIVENYFKHGFLYTEEQVGQLTIKGEQVEDQLIISVKDNGKGMTAERIAEINRALIEDHTSNSIGLRNVYVRLKLNYGDAASLQFQSLAEGGLLVRLQLPLDGEGENK